MERKDFLKLTGSFCILAGTGFIAGAMTSCSHLPMYKTVISDNKITVPLSLFTQANIQVVRTQLDYDIALRKEQDGKFSAILLRCTHADNQLVLTGNGFACNLHGSKYDEAGKVTKGPAERSLRRFATEVNNENVIIYYK